MTASIVEELRAIAPKRVEGQSTDFAFNMDGLSLIDLNEKINEAATLIEKLGEKLLLFVEIIDGTETTGLDPHVEQMLIDAAEESREALSLISGEGVRS